jgi:uncharacterized glyoxalase superfamily protein PhnB
MELTALRPILWSDKFEETIAFYTSVLGFEVSEKNDEWGWASLHKDGVALMLAKPNAHVPFHKPMFTGSFYFNTDDVDALWEKLSSTAEVCYGIEDFEWQMREFAIYDNNGYILQFGQERKGWMADQ